MLDYEKALKFSTSLNLSSFIDWQNYINGLFPELQPLPRDIPKNPNLYYRGSGWTNWQEWLGYNNRTKPKHKRVITDFVSYTDAREVIKVLKLESREEWVKYSKINVDILEVQRIPLNPDYFYREQGWTNWNDWLGCKNNEDVNSDKNDAEPNKPTLLTPSDIEELFRNIDISETGYKSITSLRLSISKEMAQSGSRKLKKTQHFYKAIETADVNIFIFNNLSIQELLNSNLISVRSFNCCDNADLMDLNTLATFFNTWHGEFNKLRNIGKKSMLELFELLLNTSNYIPPIVKSTNNPDDSGKNTLNEKDQENSDRILKKYHFHNIEELTDYFISNNRKFRFKPKHELTKLLLSSSDIIKYKFKNITIQQLNYNDIISNRAFQVCINNQLIDLYSIKVFFINNLYFGILRNCGTKTNRELADLMINTRLFLDPIPETFASQAQKNNTTSSSNPVSNCTFHDLQEYLEINNNQKRQLKSRFKAPNLLLEKYLEYKSKLKYKRKGHHDEDIFKEKQLIRVINGIKKVNSNGKILHEADPIFWDLQVFIIKKFGVLISSEEFLKLTNNKGELNIFLLLKSIIETQTKDRNLKIFLERNIIELNKRFKPLNDIGDDYSLTRERIRQIVISSEKTVLSLIKSLVIRFPKLFTSNKFINGTTITVFSQDKQRELFAGMNININFKFFVNSLKVIYRDTFKTIKFNNFFIFIPKEYKNFDFKSYLQFLSSEREKKMNVDLSINAIIPRYNSGEYNNKLRIECARLGELIFDFLIEDDYRTFKYKRSSSIHDLIEQVLEESGRPMHVNEIYTALCSFNPIKYNSPGAIKRFLYENKNINSFGRTSTFGLIKWDYKGNFKSGTIREIVLDYLIKLNKPASYEEVTAHVLNFRKTTQRNIITNLKLDPSKRLKFQKGYIFIK